MEAKNISALATIVDKRARPKIGGAQLPSDSPAPGITEIASPPGRTRRLRIAIVSPMVGTGAGVPHYWQALANVLAQDHEVHVFTAQANRDSLDGIVVHKVRAPLLGWFLLHVGFYVAVRTRFALDRLLRREGFDLILGIGALTPFADVATVHFVQARELDLQDRGLFPPERPSGGLSSIDYALYSRTMGWLGRNFYRRSSTRIVAISEAVKQDLVLFEGAAARAIEVVPNGVDVDRFHPSNRVLYRAETRAALGLTDKNPTVLFVGNSWGRKGLCTAIEAIRGDDMADVRLVVVGEGSEAAFLDGVPADVASRIIFAGRNQLAIERFYAAADVFLLPTLYEPFGLVILEALASGVPTIVSATAGASEWLAHGIDALLLQDPSDGEEARAALQSILGSAALASSLSRSGRSKAETLQWAQVADRIIATVPARSPGSKSLAPAPVSSIPLEA